LHIVKQVDRAAGRGTATLAALGAQRQAGDRRALHRDSELAFEQRLGQQRQKIDAEQRLNPAGLLEIYRSHLKVCLHVTEPLLQRRLALVGQQHLQLRQRAVVGEIDQAVLSRFMAGKSSLSFDSIDKLADVLNLELRPRRKARKDG